MVGITGHHNLGARRFLDAVLDHADQSLTDGCPSWDAYLVRSYLQELLSDLEEGLGQVLMPEPDAPAALEVGGTLQPRWVKSHPTHRLMLGDRVVKQVRPLAKNVIRLFDAFEEEGWPSRIDYPIDKTIVHETISSANENLEGLRFRGDGTAEGICWERV
jgi:hypothetical protein